MHAVVSSERAREGFSGCTYTLWYGSRSFILTSRQHDWSIDLSGIQSFVLVFCFQLDCYHLFPPVIPPFSILCHPYVNNITLMHSCECLQIEPTIIPMNADAWVKEMTGSASDRNAKCGIPWLPVSDCVHNRVNVRTMTSPLSSTGTRMQPVFLPCRRGGYEWDALFDSLCSISLFLPSITGRDLLCSYSCQLSRLQASPSSPNSRTHTDRLKQRERETSFRDARKGRQQIVVLLFCTFSARRLFWSVLLLLPSRRPCGTHTGVDAHPHLVSKCPPVIMRAVLQCTLWLHQIRLVLFCLCVCVCAPASRL